MKNGTLRSRRGLKYSDTRTPHVILALLFCFVLTSLPKISIGNTTVTFTLKEAIERALKHNKGIALTIEKAKEAEAGQIVARAKFFPTLSASASYTRLAEAPGMEFAGPSEYGMVPVYDTMTMSKIIGYTPGITGYDTFAYSMGSQNVYALRASLRYPIFTWWKVTNAYKISSLGLDAAKEELRKKENEIRFAVTEAFLRIQLANKSLGLARESLKQLEEHVKQAQALYNAGRISRFDYLRAKVQLTGVKVQVTQARNGLALAIDTLKNLLDVGFEDQLIIRGALVYLPYKMSLSEAISSAMENRPEIKGVGHSVEMARRGVDIAKAGNKPNLVFAGNYDYKNPNASGKEKWGTDWNVNLSLNIPLFQGGEVMGKVKQAEAQLEQAKLGREQLEDGIKLEVRNALLQLNSSRDLLSSHQENVKEAGEALKIAKTRYRNGLITNLEYLDAQVALSRAQTGHVRTLADYLIAKARLERATGK